MTYMFILNCALKLVEEIILNMISIQVQAVLSLNKLKYIQFISGFSLFYGKKGQGMSE